MNATLNQIAKFSLVVAQVQDGSTYNQGWDTMAAWTAKEDKFVVGTGTESERAKAIVLDMARDNGDEGAIEDVENGSSYQGGWLVKQADGGCEFLYQVRAYDAEGKEIEN